MLEPGVIRTRLWTERGLLPIHSEHNLPEGKLRREMTIFADRCDPL